jgi:hypothetical protein
MRPILLLALLVGGWACDDTAAPPLSADLSVPVADAGVDLGLLTCNGIYSCINACAPGTLNSCVPACIARGSTAAQAKFLPLQQCSGPACYTTDGNPPCANPSSSACKSCVLANCATEAAQCTAN